MSDLAKIYTSHLSRLAYVYLRQSNPAQVERNRESTCVPKNGGECSGQS
jgi:hypothetical protein